jgi:hypothetical protein
MDPKANQILTLRYCVNQLRITVKSGAELSQM